MRTVTYPTLAGTNPVTPTRAVIQPIKPRPWISDASCQYEDEDQRDEIFFPASALGAGEAVRICGGCPVRKQCAAYALETEATYGVWAGVYLPGTDSLGLHRDRLHRVAYGNTSQREVPDTKASATRRERHAQVRKLVAFGWGYKQIAAYLEEPETTIRSDISSINPNRKSMAELAAERTARIDEVARLSREGGTVDEIAELVGVSPQTVRVYRRLSGTARTYRKAAS